jgi:DNA-binding CsgD family transcriptional regulator
MNWVQQGKTNFEIALILEVSPLTVKNHLQKLFKRLDVHNRTHAVAKRMASSGTLGLTGPQQDP